jgi:hypothetical protein
MRTVIKSKLLVSESPSELNDKLQKVINNYNSEGLIVKIESSYSATSNVTGENYHQTKLYDYILVVGYAKE